MFDFIADSLQALKFIIYYTFFYLIFAFILILVMLLCFNELHMNQSFLKLMLNMRVFIINITDLTEYYIRILD